LYHWFAAGAAGHLTQGVRYLLAMALTQLVKSHSVRSRRISQIVFCIRATIIQIAVDMQIAPLNGYGFMAQ
jgi:hypothetical protein